MPHTPDHLLLNELLHTINLTPIAPDVYQAPSFDYVGKRIFGGQVLAQALMAGALTLTTDNPCHSFHSYFLRGGDIRYPVIYQVVRLRDGRSLSARQITAIQHIPNDDGTSKEQIIFVMMASFSPMEGGLDYQQTMPNCPSPHLLKNEQTLKPQYLSKVPEALRHRFMKKRHVEIRPISPKDPLFPTPASPHQSNWLRINGLTNQPVAVHQALLAFVSDFYLVGTALMPHGLSYASHGLQVASIDHAMHFHRPFDIGQWLLYDMWSDTTSHAKGLNHGQFWQEGKLIATTTQEGLMRLTAK